MLVACDPFDPNALEPEIVAWEKAHARVYLDPGGYRYVILDGIDYQWATQWRWCAKKDHTGSVYARRAVGVNKDGARLLTYSLYLHVELKRRLMDELGERPPSSKHTLVDHRNGNTSDNRRKNLRWATPGMNIRNRRGRYSIDFFDAELSFTKQGKML